MLLNEFLKEHRVVQQQGPTILRLQRHIAVLTAGLQRISARVDLPQAARQTVLNEH